MSTLYWFSVIGGISAVACILAIILTVALAIMFIVFMVHFVEEGSDDETTISIKKVLWKLFIPLCCTLAIGIFVPSKTDMYMIYGVGGTLDYLKSNPEAGKLPDKTIEFLNVAMDKYINENKSDESSDDKNE